MVALRKNGRRGPLAPATKNACRNDFLRIPGALSPRCSFRVADVGWSLRRAALSRAGPVFISNQVIGRAITTPHVVVASQDPSLQAAHCGRYRRRKSWASIVLDLFCYRSSQQAGSDRQGPFHRARDSAPQR